MPVATSSGVCSLKPLKSASYCRDTPSGTPAGGLIAEPGSRCYPWPGPTSPSGTSFFRNPLFLRNPRFQEPAEALGRSRALNPAPCTGTCWKAPFGAAPGAVCPRSPSCRRRSSPGVRAHRPAGTNGPRGSPVNGHRLPPGPPGDKRGGDDDLVSVPPCARLLPSRRPRPSSAVCTACVACCARMNAYKILKLVLRQFMIISPQPTPAHPRHPFRPPPRPSRPLAAARRRRSQGRRGPVM